MSPVLWHSEGKQKDRRRNIVDLGSIPPVESYPVFYFEQQDKVRVTALQGIHICGCRYNERLNSKTVGSTRLGYTGLCGELEHLKILRG